MILRKSIAEVEVGRTTIPDEWATDRQHDTCSAPLAGQIQIDEYTVVLRGGLHVKLKDAEFDVAAGQAIIVKAGEWVQYSSPSPEGAEYIAVCIPAFSPDTVHREN